MVGYRSRTSCMALVAIVATFAIFTLFYNTQTNPTHPTITNTYTPDSKHKHFYERNVEHYKPNDVLLPYVGHAADTIHIIWCGRKWFEFKHFLSLLSIMKKQQPNKVIVHYWDDNPILRDRNDYNLWYWDLKAEYYNIIPSSMGKTAPDCTNDGIMMSHVFAVLKNNGGIYINDTVVLNEHLHHLRKRPLSAAVVDKDKGLVYSNLAFLVSKTGELTADNLQALQTSNDVIQCSTSGTYMLCLL